jgi:peptidoglycan/LPS O-acetylase OafA/YrhL
MDWLFFILLNATNRSNLLPHMAQLDGLRAFAAIAVLVQHSMPIHSGPLQMEV